MFINKKLKSVLYIDQDYHLLSLVSIVLTSMANLNVHAYCNWRDVMAAAPTLRPDLLLINTPTNGADEHGLLAALRTLPATARTPVIFVTDMLGPDDLARYASQGGIGVIPKPLDVMGLPEHLLGLWEARHQPA